MNKIKFILPVLAVVIAVLGAFAFKAAPKKAVVVGTATTARFELVPGGNKLTRTDWIQATEDEECPDLHTDMPCQIQADLSGTNPSVASFNAIRTGSGDFSIAYPAVTYKPE